MKCSQTCGTLFNDYFTERQWWMEKHSTKILKIYNDWFRNNPEHHESYYIYCYSIQELQMHTILVEHLLTSTLVAMRTLLREFNKEYGIEKSILTVITDGYSHRG